MFEDEELVQLRIGLTTGPVINRMGDIFGPTVNLASRLTALARPEGTLVDAATAQALQGDARFSVRQLPPRAVRGFGMVSPFSLRPTSESD
jgi:adenylate cyclase